MRYEITLNIENIDYKLEIDTEKTKDEYSNIIALFKKKINEVVDKFPLEVTTSHILIRACLSLCEEIIDLKEKQEKFTEELNLKLDTLISLIKSYLTESPQV